MGWLNAVRGKGDGSHPALKFLEPDEHIRWIMPATGGLHPLALLVLGVAALAGVLLTEALPWLQIFMISTVVFLAAAILTMTRYRLLVVNELEVIVLRTRALRTATPVERLGSFDRAHPFEVRGSMWGQIFVGNEKLWVHRRFHDNLRQADEAFEQIPASTISPTSANADGTGADGNSADGAGVSEASVSEASKARASKESKRRKAAAASSVYRANRAKKRVKYAKRGGRR